MRRAIALAAAAPMAMALTWFAGTGTASAAANLTHADCIGIIASHGNQAGAGAGGATIAALAHEGSVSQIAQAHRCPSTSGTTGPTT